jgi:hypothetical protein
MCIRIRAASGVRTTILRCFGAQPLQTLGRDFAFLTAAIVGEITAKNARGQGADVWPFARIIAFAAP